MSAYQFSFPVSRTCLWDNSPLGNSTELSMTKNGWLFVQVSSSCVQLALNHTKTSTSKSIDCFLIARSWINEGENIMLEVDRFDPGRPNKDRTGATPTSLITGDIAVKTQVVLGAHPDTNYLTHNLICLQETLQEMKRSLTLHHTDAPDPAHLLSLRIHCSCSHTGNVTVRCGCVMPALNYQATPITPIPIVVTALARNLSGPLPLSTLQKRIKHGYITMETSRKLVLLIHSDPLVRSLPIIGVWVSGVGSVHHPMVWSACMAYANSTALSDRVWGEGGTFVSLVYCEGCTQPSFWECRAMPPPEGDHTKTEHFQIHTGEATIQMPSKHQLVGVALHPAQESTALHTLLETAVLSSSGTSRQVPISAGNIAPAMPPNSPLRDGGDLSLDSPLPSPPLFTPSQAPQRVVRDKNLSVISSLSILEQKSSESEGCSRLSPLPPSSLPPSPLPPEARVTALSDTPLPGSSSPLTSQQQTTPTSHMVTPSIHMTLEDHQRQLKTLQDEIKHLLQAQSPSSAVTTPPAASTSDAGTNTGASLCWPETPPSVHTPSSQWEEESMEPRIPDHFSVRTATTSMMSRDTATNMHLDFPSFASSTFDEPHPQALAESPSVSIPADWTEQECGQLSPTSVLSLRHHSTEDILTEALEKVRILEQLQTQRRSCLALDFAHTSPVRTEGICCSQSAGSSCSSGGSGGHIGVLDGTGLANRSNQWRKSKGSGGGGSGGDEDEDDEDKTPTPPHSRQSPFPNYLQTPYVTPLSAKNNRYLLHPEVMMNQQFSSEVSMLPVPHILCPSNSGGGSDALSFAAMLGDDCTVDENVFLADMIALKYLGLPGSRNHHTCRDQTEAQQTRGTVADYTVVDKAFSVATRQYFQRHNLVGGHGHATKGGVAAPLVEEEQGQSETLDIQALKTLPKLT